MNRKLIEHIVSISIISILILVAASFIFHKAYKIIEVMQEQNKTIENLIE